MRATLKDVRIILSKRRTPQLLFLCGFQCATKQVFPMHREDVDAEYPRLPSLKELRVDIVVGSRTCKSLTAGIFLEGIVGY